jgi:hypothetical protein
MKKIGLNSLSVWFGVIMIALVLSGAIAISFTDFMIDRLYGIKRTFFVGLLLMYTAYRCFRLYQVFNQSKYEE